MKLPAKLSKLLDKLNESIESQPHHGQYGRPLREARKALRERRFGDLRVHLEELDRAMQQDLLSDKRRNQIINQLFDELSPKD